MGKSGGSCTVTPAFQVLQDVPAMPSCGWHLQSGDVDWSASQCPSWTRCRTRQTSGDKSTPRQTDEWLTTGRLITMTTDHHLQPWTTGSSSSRLRRNTFKTHVLVEQFPPPTRLCFHIGLFVCYSFIGLSVIGIVQNVVSETCERPWQKKQTNYALITRCVLYTPLFIKEVAQNNKRHKYSNLKKQR